MKKFALSLTLIFLSLPAESTIFDEIIQRLFALDSNEHSGNMADAFGRDDVELDQLDHAIEEAVEQVPSHVQRGWEASLDNDEQPIVTKEELRQFTRTDEGEPSLYRRSRRLGRGESMREQRHYTARHYIACGAATTCGLCLAGMFIASQALKISVHVDE